MSEYIDFSSNEELKEDVERMVWLGQCFFNDGVKVGEARGEARGKTVGKNTGIDIMSKLVDILLANNRYDELQLAVSNPDKRLQLLQEYNLMAYMEEGSLRLPSSM